MMKPLWIVLGAITFIIYSLVALQSCNKTAKGSKNLQVETHFDFKQEEVKKFNPPLSWIMLSIQSHHEKLYYASEHQNWELSTYLTHELHESFKTVSDFHSNHDKIDLSNLVESMIIPVIEELEVSSHNRNNDEFTYNLYKLTNTCNDCHKTTGHSYIKVKAPKVGDYLSQKFAKDE